MKPEFVDNREGNTLAEAIRGHLGWLQENRRPPLDIAIATGYFNPGGFGLIADALEGLGRVRLLLGAEPMVPVVRARTKPSEPRGGRFDQERFRKALLAGEAGFREELNLLGFNRETDAVLRRLVAFLRSGRVEVRRFEKGFLHGKAFIFVGDEGVLSGSSNFTAAGLTTNRELNMGQYQPHVVTRVREWYEQLWDESVPYDLAAFYEARTKEYDPYLIYLRVLWERYGTELTGEAAPSGAIPLTTFQNDGLLRARRILEEYNGVVIADGVGLGKTFLAGELIREATQDRRQRVLLVSPAALRDGPWKAFAERHQIYLKNLSFEELAADKQLMPDGARHHLEADPNAYALVVVDESHSLRNPDAKRAQAMRRLLRGTPPKKLVLLTATPVNNSLWDLYYLLTYFVKHDAVFADLGIPSLKQRFEEAMREDPYSLKPDALFDLLDKVTVRRTRNFIRKHYPNERIRDAKGREFTIRFPRPHVKRLDYDLEGVLPGFLRELEDALAPEHGHPLLTMARYVPSAYLKRGKPKASQLALSGLLRSGLLKRFESSIHAFARTCEGMAKAHDKFLLAVEKGYIPNPDLMTEWDGDVASDEAFEELFNEYGAERAAGYKVEELKKDVAADREVLSSFARRARTVSITEDPKLARLKETLVEMLERAEREGGRPEEKRDLRKVLIFSYYSDTVDWIEPYLTEVIAKDKRLAGYRGRIASVAGRKSRNDVSREAAIFGFVPESAEAPPGTEDRFDILVATDVLSEGLNLQQCRNIVNYDLPWNPMRLVQRHGRIDRIGSRHKDVFIRCFFPATKLNELLDLEERLKRKLAQAAASVGVEEEPLPGAPTGEVNFADTRREIEGLREERPDLLESAGEDPHARSGEEYRQELRKGLEIHGDEIRALPWGAGSGFAKGLQRGHFFCVRIFDRVFLRFIPADDGPLVRDTLHCLRLIGCRANTPRALSPDLLSGVFASWEKARRDVFEEWSKATDPANLQPKIRPLFREIARHLRQNPPEGVTQTDLEENILPAIEAPWGLRIERELRAVFDPDKNPRERSREIVEKVRELGLMPYRAPQPLDVIEQDEVRLVCWMAVEK